MRTCDVPGCDRKHLAKGMCAVHYGREYRDSCSVDGCPKKIRAKGMCDTHYRQWRKAGWTEAEREYHRQKKQELERKRRDIGCVTCEAAKILDARGLSLTEAAATVRKPPAWLRQHLDDHGLSDVLSHREKETT